MIDRDSLCLIFLVLFGAYAIGILFLATKEKR